MARETAAAVPHILVTEPVPEEGLKPFQGRSTWRIGPSGGPNDDEEFSRLLEDAEGCLLVGNNMSGKVIKRAPRLRVISRFGIGYNGVDLQAATECRVVVCNTPQAPAEATADLALMLLLAAARRLPEAHHFVKSGAWAATRSVFPLTAEVHGRTIGIIGFGRIGQAVGRRARGFGMRVLYCDLVRQREAEATMGAVRAGPVELLEQSDFVTLHVPLTEATTGLIGKDQIACMKPGAVLVNTSRGPVVDQRALSEALRDKRIAAAGLDVFEQEPLPADDPVASLDNVVLTPHAGSGTLATRVLMVEEAMENIVAALVGGSARNVVNPEVLGRLRRPS